MGSKNPKSATEEECLKALQSVADGKSYLTAREVTDIVSQARTQGSLPDTSMGSVSSRLQVMAGSMTPKIGVDRTTTPLRYSLLSSKGKGEQKLSDPAGSTKPNDALSPPEKKPENERTLQVDDPLCIEIFHLQRPLAPGERKSERQLLRLTYSEAVVWRDELKLKAEAKDRERTEQFDARVATAVQKAMVSAPLASSEREQELESAFQTSLATAHAGLDAEKQANVDLRAQLAKLELAIANSKQEPVDRQKVTLADVPPVEDRSPKSGWLWSTAGIIGAVLVGGILICGFALLVTWVYTEVKSRKAPVAESANSQPEGKETAVQMSRRRSTPTKAELDNNPAIQRSRELIQRMEKLNEKSYNAKKGE